MSDSDAPPTREPGFDSLLLRDRLAVDRTVMANERTLLSYIRTALALAVVGASGLRFFDEALIHVAGWLFIVAGGLMTVVGVVRYRAVRARTAGPRPGAGSPGDAG